MKVFLFSIFAFAKNVALGQTLISTGGNRAAKDIYSLNYTIGETVAATLQNGNYSLSQGFQQAQIKVVSIEDFIGIKNWKIYPNPVHQVLNIEQNQEENKQYTIYILDINGHILKHIEMQTNNESLDFQEYINGIYFLNIISKENNQKASFKIIKQ